MKWYLFSNRFPADGRTLLIFDGSDGSYWYAKRSGDYIKITDNINEGSLNKFYACFKLAEWIKANGSNVCWFVLEPPPAKGLKNGRKSF